MGCQKEFTELKKMKNTQSEVKPIKIGIRPGTTYFFKDFTQFQATKSKNDKKHSAHRKI